MDDDNYRPKRRRSSNSSEEPPAKRQKTSKVPEWFRDLVTRLPDEEESESEDSEDFEDSQDDNFEEDTFKLRRTVVEHILDTFPKDQQELFAKQIETGVNSAFNLFKDLVEETLGSLMEYKSTNLWKLGMSPDEIEKYSEMISQLCNHKQSGQITIQKILDANLDCEQKSRLLNLFNVLQTSNPHSLEHILLTTKINTVIEGSKSYSKYTIDEVEAFNKKENELKKIIGTGNPLRLRILSAEIDDERKAAIYAKYLQLQKTPEESSMAANLTEWIEEALRTPYTKETPNLLDSQDPGSALIKLKEGFQEQLSEMNSVLEPLLSVFNNRMQQPNAKSLVIGLLGSPGVGKSSVGKVIANVWNLPFQQISLGGMVDSTILDGKHQGWLGSGPGLFTKALQKMGVINGVLFLDEIDKLGKTPRGLEVQYSLLHSTDPVQNSHYNDHYLGSQLPLDLSKCLIICALNKTDGIDPALLDRMHIIKVPDYTKQQKTTIMLNHLLPLALENAGIDPNLVVLPIESCNYIQDRVEQCLGKEGGVRSIKGCVRMIVDKLSLLIHTSADDQEKLRLTFKVETQNLPIVITPKVIDELYKPTDLGNEWRYLYI